MQDAQTFAEVFRGIMCYVSLTLLAILLSATAIAWLAKTVAVPLRRLFGGGIVRAVLAVAMVGTGIVESFSKHTNDPPRRAASPMLAVTPTDISNGWRVAATREGRAPSRPQDGTYTIHEPWLVRGGFDDFMRISADGWSFPWRNGFTDGLTVFSDGEIRLALRTPYFPRPFDAPLAVVPAFNWHLLPGGVSNVFWHAATPSNSLVVAWENAPVNYDVSCLTNFQAEFFAGGHFSYRYDDRVVDYAPVFPFDWDNDGLENSVDPDPLVAGPDAHGTNAEWYNVLCSNVLEVAATSAALPLELAWLEGVNSNAYYFVDVVASNGPAPIYFTGDRDSRLGNPVVVARGGETNHVPLLIGVSYAITSTVPFSVSLPDDGFATITTNCVSNYVVQWPLEFTVVPDGMGYSVSAGPYDPGCEFQWQAPTRSATCSYTTDGGWIGFSCNVWSCECGGCSVSGVAMLEDVSFALPHVWCGCWRHGSGNSGNGQYATNGPSVFVSFDNPVVFYEDAYTNAPNDVVAKHSTNTTLTVFAYGGEAGGMLYISEQKIGKLVRVGGKAISFPYTAFVPPQRGVSFSIEYEAETHSDFQNDISVSASMLPGDGGVPCTASASVTAAEILIEAEASFPTNKHRHVFGPAERVIYSIDPPGVSFTLQGNVPSQGEHDHLQGRIVMPFCASQFTMEVVNANVSLSLPFAVIEPEAELHLDNVRLPTAKDWSEAIQAAPLTEGDIGSAFHADMSLRPNTVSFANIILMEGEAAASDIHGFFTNSIFNGQLNHDIAAGAYREMDVHDENIVGTGDNAFLGLNSALLPYLRDGDFKLQIPLYWYVDGGVVTNTLLFLEVRNFVYQNADVKVCKYNVSAIRGTNDVTNIQR